MYRQFYIRFVSIGAVLLLLCGGMLHSHAQSRDSLLGVYNNQTIHTYGNVYIKGTRRLSFAALKPEFTSPVTADLYKKSKANVTFSSVLTVTSLAALVTSAVIRKNNRKGALVWSVAGIGLNLGSYHFRRQSTQLLERAIWQRNKEVLFGIR